MLETIKQTIKTLINFRTAALLTVTSIPAVTIAAARGNRYALEAISYIPGGPQALKFIINNKILEGLAAVASVATASLGYYAFKQYLDARSYIRRYKNGEIKGPSLISDAARSPVAALHTHVDRIHKSLGDTVTFFTDRDRTLDVVSLGQFGHLVKTTVANDPMQIVLLHAEDADTLARAFGFPHDSSRAGGRVEIIPFNISDVNDPDRALEDVLAGFRRLRFEPKLDNNAKVEVIDGVKYIRNQYFCAVIEKTGINDGEKSEDGYSVKIYVKNPPGKNLMAIPETGETQGLVEEVVLKKSLGLLDTPDDTIPVNFVRGWLADYTQLQREIASGLSKESALARVTSLAQAVGKDALHSVKDTADDMTRASALVDLAFKLATGNLPDFAGKAARGFIGRIIKRYVDSNTGAVRADEFTLKAGTVISRIAKPFAGPTGLTLEAHPSELQKAIEDRTLVVSSMATLVPAAKRVAGHTDFTSHINNGSIPILVDRRVIDYIRNGVGTPTAGTVSITGSTGNTVAHTTRTGGYTQATFRLQDGRDVSVMVNPLGSNAFHWMPDEQDSERRAKRSAAAGRESPEFMEQLYNCVLKLQGANAVQQGWLDSFTTEMQEQSKPVERKISLSPALKQVNRNDKKYVVPAPTGIRLFFATITGSRTGEGLNEALFKRDVAQAREKYQKALNRYNDTFKAADDAWIKKVLADPQHPYRSAVSQNS
ncbi:MAG: hypothetical protein EB121_02430, partial [Alphaproteobacteria bacterium]|nr:hypothetical protein [Alphaproteobacteria bacterium]